MGISGKGNVRNCFMGTYVPNPETGRLQRVSKIEPGAPQALNPPRELRMNFFSLKMAFDFPSDPGETNG
jgi:hypothetical protein